MDAALHEVQQTVARWRSRALRAEAKLAREGLAPYDPRQIYTDSEWMVLTLEAKDGSVITVEQLQAARAEVEATGRKL